MPDASHGGVDSRDQSTKRLEEAALRFLREAARPMTLSELSTRLRARRLRAPDYEIARCLRLLRHEGRVQVERGRWSATDHRPPPPATAPPVTAPPANETRPDWSPTRSWLQLGTDVGGAGTCEPASPAQQAKQDESGPWATFRKLLDYYGDCVRSEQGSEAAANLSDLGRRFVALQGVGGWYPRTGHPWKLRLVPTPEIGAVIRYLEGSGDAGVLLLGYPLWIHSPPPSEGEAGEPFLKPIFTCAVEYEARGDYLQIFCDDASLDVNLDWLSYALRRPEQQQAFLAMAGLMDRRGPEEEVGDGSGDVLVPDLRSLAVAVATFFGQQVREPLRPEAPSLIRSSPRPQSGIYNHAVLMVGNRTRYAQSLLRDLARIRQYPDEALDRTALRPIFRGTAPESPTDTAHKQQSSEVPCEVVDTCDLNTEQRGAIASILSEPVTVVTGPPGTGKSQVVAGAIANARLCGQTVVFASRNHKAIDAVVTRPEMVTDNDLPLVVRANDKEGVHSFSFVDAIKELLSSPHDPSAEDQRLKAQQEIERCLTIRRGLIAQADERERLREALAQLENEIATVSAGWTDEEVQSLDVRRQTFPSQRVKQILRLLPAIRETTRQPPLLRRLVLMARTWRARRLASSLKRVLESDLSWLMEGIDDFSLAGLPSIAAVLPKLDLAVRYCEARLKQQPLEAQASTLPPIEALAAGIKEATVDVRRLAPIALEADARARAGLPQDADRSGLASLQVALRRHANALVARQTDHDAKSALDANLPNLLWHYPAWAVTNLSVGSRMPLSPGMFDVAIIDEASQCDIASAIPLLFRARRAAVVGDPLQLAHTTSLTRSRDNVLCRRNGITSLREQRFSFPDTSLFDLFAQTNSVNPVFLRDHYRCAPAIAQYANRTFYGSRLRVLTAASKLRVPAGRPPGIHWTQIDSELSPRRTGCVAPDEAKECRTVLRQMLLEQKFEGTVGVVTPFREQKQLLIEVIEGDPELFEAGRRASLIIDTAHGFQGDERDVILMSLSAGPTMPATSLGWLHRTGNLLNVAATRARAVLHVIGNRTWAERCGIPHIVALTRTESASAARATSSDDPFESPWEKRLYNALEARGMQPIPQYPLLGRRLDLALVREGRTPIDIEVDGATFHLEPDGSRRRDDIWRDITVQGAGWKVLRFWVYQLRNDLDGCVERVRREWEAP